MTMTLTAMELSAFIACALVGWLLKVLEKVVAIREQDDTMTLMRYIAEDRYRLTISVLGTAVLLGLCYTSGQLNLATALSCGYVGESASRFLTKLNLK